MKVKEINDTLQNIFGTAYKIIYEFDEEYVHTPSGLHNEYSCVLDTDRPRGWK